MGKVRTRWKNNVIKIHVEHVGNNQVHSWGSRRKLVRVGGRRGFWRELRDAAENEIGKL